MGFGGHLYEGIAVSQPNIDRTRSTMHILLTDQADERQTGEESDMENSVTPGYENEDGTTLATAVCQQKQTRQAYTQGLHRAIVPSI
jgi:hypothetical protein